MKKLLAIMLCLILAFSIAACGKTPSANDNNKTDATAPQTTANAEDKPLIGITVPEAPTGWVAAVQWAADQTAKRLNLNYKLLVSADENTQANHIDELINEQNNRYNCSHDTLVQPHRDQGAGTTLINFDRTLGQLSLLFM